MLYVYKISQLILVIIKNDFTSDKESNCIISMIKMKNISYIFYVYVRMLISNYCYTYVKKTKHIKDIYRVEQTFD
jgi:hypothetical protein